MTAHQHIPGGLAAMRATITEVTIKNHPCLPRKKRDDNDTYLGTLPDDIQRLWLHMETYRGQTSEIVAKVEDLIAIHKGEHTRCGATLPVDTCKKFVTDVEALLNNLDSPYRTFLALRHIFDAEVFFEFPQTSGAKVIGIRENFELVTRAHDNRGDTDDPLDPIRQCLDGEIHITFVMEKVKTPDIKPPSAG